MMMAKIAALTLVLIEVTAITARAQAPVERPETAHETFDALSAGITTGLFFQGFHKGLPDYENPFPTLMEVERFRSTHPNPFLRREGGHWRASDPTGTVSMGIWVPDLGDRSQDMGRVTFVPARPSPMPAPILTHLLSKAVRTTISGAETIELALARERTTQPFSCWSDRTLTIAMGTGAMLAHTITTVCEGPREDVPSR